MNTLEQHGDSRFAQPWQQLFLMAAIVILVGGGVYLFRGFAMTVFWANAYLNGVIVGVFLVGILACFWQILQICDSVRWVGNYLDAEAYSFDKGKPPRLLASLAVVLDLHEGSRQLAASSTQSILESVSIRMDESRDIARYLSNLLIFLGLLGTFFGLATTVPAVVDVIQALEPSEGEETIIVFGRLMQGLERQLGGMGTAFSSSLIGLAGSLVVGLLDLFAGHGQNHFYRQLEERLSGLTRVDISRFEADTSRALTGRTVRGGRTDGGYVGQGIPDLQFEGELTGVIDGKMLGEVLVQVAQELARQAKAEEMRREDSARTQVLLENILASQQEIARQLSDLATDYSDARVAAALNRIAAELVRGRADIISANEELIGQIRDMQQAGYGQSDPDEMEGSGPEDSRHRTDSH